MTLVQTKVTGSEALLKCLIEEEVDLLFGYPGGAIMPVYDALYGYQDKLRHILSRHEQGAIHAAQGYARASGKPGVVLVTSGPGATNLITGIADAQIDSTPLVCISGQVASHLLGTDAFQETDVIGISMPVTKWSVQISKASEIPAAVAKAFYIAKSGRPGPVLIDITKDAQFEEMEFEYKKCEGFRSYRPIPTPDLSAILDAATLINSAKKPYILVGQGVKLSNAEDALLAVMEKAGIPAASTLLGLSAIEVSHPLYVGYLGMHGNYGPNIKTNECDVLIAIGMRFDDRVTGDVKRYARQAKVIHIDIDAAEINKIIPVDVAIHSDAKKALELLLPLIKENTHTEWLEEFSACDRMEDDKIRNREKAPTEGGIYMSEVIHLLSNLEDGNTITVTDVGQHQMVTSRYYEFKKGSKFISSGGLGTMGFALPAAIGAALGAPEKDVIAVIGDGGFQMTLQEMGVIMEYGLKVKILILNNEFLGMVRQWQQMFFDRRYSFTEMKNPNFQLLAESYGIRSALVKERADLPKAIREFRESKESFLLEVRVEKETNVFPMIPTGASVSDVLLA